jgi:hypothetical protein
LTIIHLPPGGRSSSRRCPWQGSCVREGRGFHRRRLDEVRVAVAGACARNGRETARRSQLTARIGICSGDA